MKGEKTFTKQERFRGNWMDMIDVRITPERAEIMSMDHVSTGIRYVEKNGKEGELKSKDESADIQDLNVPQLKKYARDKGYDIGDARKKVDILAAIAKNIEVQ